MIVDFHTHHVAPGVEVVAPHHASVDLAAAWPQIAASTTDAALLLRESDRAGVDHRVLSAPPSMVTAPGERTPADRLTRMNDHLSELVAARPERFSGLASIDVFTGDQAATEVHRAVGQLGLHGIVVDCASGDLLVGDEPTLPALRAAADLDVPVFVHPVSDPTLASWFDGLGRLGTSLARSGACSAALVNVLVRGVLDDLPSLRYVTPMLGGPAALLAASTDIGATISGDAADGERRHVYLDTMGFAPSAVRFATDFLGADHVVIGSDWPIGNRAISAERVRDTLERAGVGGSDAERVSGTNALALLHGPHGQS